MTAYYNEIDTFAAAWLRELIKAGHIAPGEVDTRSIADVMPSDLAGFAQCHFFAGIGVWSYALRRAGWKDDRPVWTGSCPCQPFSSAGKGKGFKDERHLWPEFYRLISQCRPATCFGEQVASKDGLAWVELVQADLESSNYTFGAVDFCSAGVGAPHLRQRLYWVGSDTLGNAALRGCIRGEVGNEAGPQCTTLGSRKNEVRWGYDVADDGACMRVAHAHYEGSQRRLGVRQCAIKCTAGESRVVGGLANSDNTGRQLFAHAEPTGICRETITAGEQVQQLGSDSPSACGLAHAERAGLSQRGNREVLPIIGCNCGENCWLADSESPRRGICNAENVWPSNAQINASPDPSNSPINKQQRPSTELPGPTNGFWRDADWLLCRDGKWRPVESSNVQMADGLADRLGYLRIGDRWSLNPLIQKAENRVGRLKGYGNAINAEQAKEFIEAFMEVDR